MDASTVVTLLSGTGGALGFACVFLVLFATGRLHSDTEFRRETHRGSKEAERGDRLEQALAESRRALAEANARAEAAVRSSEIIADALAPRARKARPRDGDGVVPPA